MIYTHIQPNPTQHKHTHSHTQSARAADATLQFQNAFTPRVCWYARAGRIIVHCCVCVCVCACVCEVHERENKGEFVRFIGALCVDVCVF